MSYNLPSFRQLLTRVQTDLGSAADGTTPRGTIEYALARGLAGLSKHLFSALAYVLRQCSPLTADEVYGWRWGFPFGITQQPAQTWQGTAEATGDPGGSILLNTEFQRADGQLYRTTTGTVIGLDGTAVLTLAASAAGAAGNNPDGQTLSLTSPLAGVDTDITVTGSTTSGADVEKWDPEGKTRLARRARNPPKGGGPGDYEGWAREVPGVTRAWEFPLLEGDVSVSVAFARDKDGGLTASSDALPDSGERATVLAYLLTKAPVHVRVRVITLGAYPVDITLGSLSPDTPAVRASIEASVRDLLVREGRPGGTIPLSRLADAVSSAVGEASHTMALPTETLVTPTNQLPVLGTITYPT